MEPVTGPALEALLSWSKQTRADAIAALFTVEHPHTLLSAAILGAERPTIRLELVDALKAVNDASFAITAGVCLVKGDADVVAHIARAVCARCAALDTALDQGARGTLPRLLETARARCARPLVNEAVDDALLALGVFGPLVRRLGSLAPKTAARLIVALLHVDEDAVAALAFDVVQAVDDDRRLIGIAARLVVRVAEVVPSTRKPFFHGAIAILANDDRPLTEKLAVIPVVDASFQWPIAIDARVLSVLVEHTNGPIRDRVIELLGRLGTEDAATILATLATQTETTSAATTALTTLVSPVVEVARDDDGIWTVTPVYSAPDGTRLEVSEGSLKHPENGSAWALDRYGLPVAVDDAADGACVCCERPRVLVDRHGVAVCPMTAKARPRPVVVGPAHEEAEAPRKSWDFKNPPPEVQAALDRHVVFRFPQARQHAGVVVGVDGNRIAILLPWHYTSTYADTATITCGSERVTARRTHDAGFYGCLFEATLSAPFAAPIRVSTVEPAIGSHIFVPTQRGSWAPSRINVQFWHRGSLSLICDDVPARVHRGSGIYSDDGALVALVDSDNWLHGRGVASIIRRLQSSGATMFGTPISAARFTQAPTTSSTTTSP